jgi:hypothetical protein
MMPVLMIPYAEFCFKVNDDFSNIVDAWNAVLSIVKDMTVEYGRCGTSLLSPYPAIKLLGHTA